MGDDDLESAERSFEEYTDEPEDAESPQRAPYRDQVPEAPIAPVGQEQREDGSASQAGRRDDGATGEGGLKMVGGALMGTGSN